MLLSRTLLKKLRHRTSIHNATNTLRNRRGGGIILIPTKQHFSTSANTYKNDTLSSSSSSSPPLLGLLSQDRQINDDLDNDVEIPLELNMDTILAEMEYDKLNSEKNVSDYSSAFDESNWESQRWSNSNSDSNLDSDPLIASENDKKDEFDYPDAESIDLLPWEIPNTTEEFETFTDPAIILKPRKKFTSPLEVLSKHNTNVVLQQESHVDGDDVTGGKAKKGRGKGKGSSKVDSSHQFNMVYFERDLKSIMNFKKELSQDEVIKSIDEMRPEKPVISIKKYDQLVKNMSRSFKANQMKDFLDSKNIKTASKSTKKTLINKIISQCWGIEKSSSTSNVEEDFLIVEQRIALNNKRETFLLLSNTGYLVHTWTRLGAKLGIKLESNELVVRGTSEIVKFVQASWNQLLNSVYTSTLKLEELDTFYKELGKTIPLNSLQMLSNVHFDKVEDEDSTYILSSFNDTNLFLAKSGLLAALEYSATSSTVVDKTFVKDITGFVHQSYDDNTLPWYTKDSELGRIKKPASRKRTTSFEVIPTDTDLLSMEINKLKAEVDTAEDKFQHNFIAKEQEEEEEVIENLIEGETHDNEIESDSISKVKVLRNLDSDKIYEELSSQVPEIKEHWRPNVINATYGKMLFQNSTMQGSSHFHLNLPEVNKKLSSLELYDKEAKLFGSNGGVRNYFQNSLQIKLVPDGFANFEYFKKLPSIEIWFSISRDRINKSDCNVIITESERNVQIPIPEFKNDLMYQSTYNSDLINTEIDDELKFQQKQPGIFEFVKSLPSYQLDISKPESISKLLGGIPSHTINIKLDSDSEPVPYLISVINKVRSIELEFKGCPVIYQVISNGDVERFEVSILKTDEVDKDSFKEFNETAVELLQFIEDK